MCLQSVLGVHVFSDAIGEGVVDAVPLVDHCLAAPVQQLLDATAHVLRRGAFRLRALHIVVAELGPSLRDRLTEKFCGLAGLRRYTGVAREGELTWRRRVRCRRGS